MHNAKILLLRAAYCVIVDMQSRLRRLSARLTVHETRLIEEAEYRHMLHSWLAVPAIESE